MSREVKLACLARASSACMQQALLSPSAPSSNLGFAFSYFLFFIQFHSSKSERGKREAHKKWCMVNPKRHHALLKFYRGAGLTLAASR